MFASRQRTRHQVTLRALSMRMKKEGFEHKDAEYAQVLKLLSESGFGTLEKDGKGRVKALKNVVATLQSLGAAVAAKGKSVQSSHPRPKFRTIVSNVVTDNADKTPSTPIRLTSDISLTLKIGNRPVNLPMPSDLTAEEIGYVVAKLRNSK